MAIGFRIAARTLRHLGSELITSDDIALNELIKNSFDAHSPKVKIRIESPFNYKTIDNAHRYNDVHSFLDDIFASTISDTKREHIKEKLETISNIQEVITLLPRYQKIIVEDTGDGMSKDQLENAFLVVGTPTKWLQKNKSDSSSEKILGDKGIGRLSMMRLGNKSIVKSTTSNCHHWHKINFDWNLFEDPSKYLDEIDISVIQGKEKINRKEKGTQIIIFDLNKNWEQKDAEDFAHSYLRRLQDPFNFDDFPYPINIYYNDTEIQVSALYDWFIESANFQAKFQFTPDVNNSNDIVLKREIKWHNMETFEPREWKVSELTTQLGYPLDELKRLGAFSGNCLWFNRGKAAIRNLDIDHDAMKTELGLWPGGFAIYRDGFRIGLTGSLEDDWLEMDKTSLKSKGYALNRYQTVGTVNITSSNNKELVDSSNRERLISCPAYKLLQKIMQVAIIQDLRSNIHAVKILEDKIDIAEDTTLSTLETSKNSLKKTLENVIQLKKKVPKEHTQQFKSIEDSLKSHIEDVRNFENKFSELSEKNIEILELAGIGLVVEKVIHELNRLTSSTQDYLSELQKKGISDDVSSTINILKEQMNVTNKRIRTVDVLSPSGRQRKGIFNLTGLINSILEANTSKLIRHKVTTKLLVDDDVNNKKFNVNMVQGLVAQILENLINNSVHWLGQGLLPGATEPLITIEIDTISKTLSYYDNGPGIEPRYRNDILKPYFTTRKNGKGLGLYIAQELAEYHKANFYLENKPSVEDGRLRCFILELPRDA
ncbi:sensor histidine kinase [Pectobacterium carotovorum]|uniref:sensor histidine kinase n=1 Tax=Pectobacterium carotovorum TaxID=554 RepID=UPI00057FAA4A|nr:sensor histidine kinase [Pectobacterium carotovorum]KHT28431.1 hypothetical protein RC98_07965 [Pectobacterium carotovorum subsp. carotovorum]